MKTVAEANFRRGKLNLGWSLYGFLWSLGPPFRGLTVTINPLYTIKKNTIVCKVVGGARTANGQAECFEDQILGRCFGLEKWSDH